MDKKQVASQSKQGMFADKAGKPLPLAMQSDYTTFYFGSGNDPFDMLGPFDEWWKVAVPAGYYLYGLPMQGEPGKRVDVPLLVYGSWAAIFSCRQEPSACYVFKTSFPLLPPV